MVSEHLMVIKESGSWVISKPANTPVYGLVCSARLASLWVEKLESSSLQTWELFATPSRKRRDWTGETGNVNWSRGHSIAFRCCRITGEIYGASQIWGGYCSLREREGERVWVREEVITIAPKLTRWYEVITPSLYRLSIWDRKVVWAGCKLIT